MTCSPKKTLFVRNLPQDVLKDDLTRVFQKYGPVDQVLILI